MRALRNRWSSQMWRSYRNSKLGVSGLGIPNPVSKDKVEDCGKGLLKFLQDGESLFDNIDTAEAGQPGRKLTDKDPTTTAKNYVISLLARGPQTEFNLRTKLTGKNVTQEIIDEIIEDLQRCGLQSDAEYAEIFARSRWTDNTWGPKRIKLELLRRGISQETVEAALVKLFKTNDDAEDQEDDLGTWGMTKKASEHLIAQARRRWQQGDAKIEVKRRRMVGWLQRRGFPWSIIPDVLRIIESETDTYSSCVSFKSHESEK
jgi:SOS response regulatory protein OraA/RecX